MIQFSIVIPLYNKACEIVHTLFAVHSQTYTKWELIVVDDGSTDNSAEVVEQFITQHPEVNIKLVRKQNGGVCSARNKGIQESREEYIAFLDADDIWYPTYLEEQARMIIDFPLAAMWGGNWIEKEGQQKTLLPTGLPMDYRGYITNYFERKLVSDIFCSSTVVIRKTAFAVVGLFDERIRYSEDLDMWYRIILHFPVAFNAKCLVEYRLDSTNRAMQKNIPLQIFLPYYIAKYDSYCEQNRTFSHFIHTFAAANLVPYYFGGKDRLHAREVIKKLRFQDIHHKYKLWYTLPYLLGCLIYKLTLLRHKI